MTPPRLRRILLGTTSAAVLTAAVDVPGPGRAFVVLAFFMAVPGLALVHRLGLALTATSATFGIAVSLATSTLLAQLSIAVGEWRPTALLLGLAAATCGLLLWPSPEVEA